MNSVSTVSDGSSGIDIDSSLPSSSSSSSYQIYDIQNLARWIEHVHPFSLLLLLLVFVRQHLQGISPDSFFHFSFPIHEWNKDNVTLFLELLYKALILFRYEEIFNCRDYIAFLDVQSNYLFWICIYFRLLHCIVDCCILV